VAELFVRKTTEVARPPSSFVPSLDPLLEDIILHGLEREPKNRQPSARVFFSELAEVRRQLREPASDQEVVNLSAGPSLVPSTPSSKKPQP
jgi:hypothetical protein